MGNVRELDPLEVLTQRLKGRSTRLNEQKAFQEPTPASRLPEIDPVITLLHCLANQLPTLWYVAPQMEQLAHFAQKTTAAYDDLASLLPSSMWRALSLTKSVK